MTHPLSHPPETPDDTPQTATAGTETPKLQIVSAAAPIAPTQPHTMADRAQKEPSRTMLDLHVDNDAENIKSYLAAGDVINGDLEVRGGARIDGHVRGSLICHDGSAIISEVGVVDGSVRATHRIIVSGKVGQGDAGQCAVDCPGDIVVLGNGSIEATVSYGNLVTYDGGQITGRISRYAKR